MVLTGASFVKLTHHLSPDCGPLQTRHTSQRMILNRYRMNLLVQIVLVRTRTWPSWGMSSAILVEEYRYNRVFPYPTATPSSGSPSHRRDSDPYPFNRDAAGLPATSRIPCSIVNMIYLEGLSNIQSYTKHNVTHQSTFYSVFFGKTKRNSTVQILFNPLSI